MYQITDFLSIYIYRRYYQILYTFQSSYKLILIFSESYDQTVHTFQSSYIPILIFYESYNPTIHIFHSSYKPLLANKTLKTFSEFIQNSTDIFKELLSNDTDFFRLLSNNKLFQIELLLILPNIFIQIVLRYNLQIYIYSYQLGSLHQMLSLLGTSWVLKAKKWTCSSIVSSRVLIPPEKLTPPPYRRKHPPEANILNPSHPGPPP